MTGNGWLQIALFAVAVLLITKPLGLYLVAVYEGRVHWLCPVERLFYRAAGVDAATDQHWTDYAGSMLLFSGVSLLLTYLALRLQHALPLNAQHLPAVVDRQAFETATSFTANTNWQSYSGETTMSYLSQMAQLAFHNFVSAAVGMALAVALVRGIARRAGWELLGRPGARDTLCAAPAVTTARVDPGAAGCDPEFPALPRGHHPGGGEPGVGYRFKAE